jgi:hypothetical protein
MHVRRPGWLPPFPNGQGPSRRAAGKALSLAPRSGVIVQQRSHDAARGSRPAVQHGLGREGQHAGALLSRTPTVAAQRRRNRRRNRPHAVGGGAGAWCSSQPHLPLAARAPAPHTLALSPLPVQRGHNALLRVAPTVDISPGTSLRCSGRPLTGSLPPCLPVAADGSAACVLGPSTTAGGTARNLANRRRGPLVFTLERCLQLIFISTCRGCADCSFTSMARLPVNVKGHSLGVLSFRCQVEASSPQSGGNAVRSLLYSSSW